MRRKKKLSFHQRLHHHLNKHFHRHIHKVLHFVNHFHHNLFHGLELVVIALMTVSSGSFLFANLTGLNEQFYRQNPTEVASELLNAMQSPGTSLKQGNIISIWSMDSDIENSFAKGYCTYGAARVSPEFFPFVDEKIQQRTWGGNAVDRCKNASDTGYKIGTTPSQGALIVYDAGGKFGSYGHVGKVLHYEKKRNKIIVRDMAWVAKGMMSDRREDTTTANVKCYIYNSKTNVPEPTGTTVTPTIPVAKPEPVATPTPVVIVPVVKPEPVVSTPVITPDTGIKTPVKNPTPNIKPTPGNILIPIVKAETELLPVPVVRPIAPAVKLEPVVKPEPITIPVAEVVAPLPVVSQTLLNKKLELTFDNLSAIAQHFITQNDITITLVSKSPLRLGEVATITLEIKDKKSGELYSGLLPFSFTLLTTNDSLQSDISNIEIINNGSVDISILGQKSGTASIVINMDDVKIGEFSMEVK